MAKRTYGSPAKRESVEDTSVNKQSTIKQTEPVNQLIDDIDLSKMKDNMQDAINTIKQKEGLWPIIKASLFMLTPLLGAVTAVVLSGDFKLRDVPGNLIMYLFIFFFNMIICLMVRFARKWLHKRRQLKNGGQLDEDIILDNPLDEHPICKILNMIYLIIAPFGLELSLFHFFWSLGDPFEMSWFIALPSASASHKLANAYGTIVFIAIILMIISVIVSKSYKYSLSTFRLVWKGIFPILHDVVVTLFNIFKFLIFIPVAGWAIYFFLVILMFIALAVIMAVCIFVSCVAFSMSPLIASIDEATRP